MQRVLSGHAGPGNVKKNLKFRGKSLACLASHDVAVTIRYLYARPGQLLLTADKFFTCTRPRK